MTYLSENIEFLNYFTPVFVERPGDVDRLVSTIKTFTRSGGTAAEIRRFVEPFPGTLDQAKSRNHHVVFGRRGSGKTALLRKAQQDLLAQKHPVAFVDLDVYDKQTLPNLIASVIRDALTQYHHLTSALPRRPRRVLATILDQEIRELDKFIAAPDEAKALRSILADRLKSRKRRFALGFKLFRGAQFTADASGKDEEREKEGIDLDYAISKEAIIYNHIGFYKRALKQVADAFGEDSYLILDELYHLPIRLQPFLVDYMHSLVRNNGTWLKIGTVTYRSNLLTRTEDGSVGIEMRQDAQPIYLDRSFEQFGQTKSFLLHILLQFANEVGLKSLNDLTTEIGAERLIQASGGVARDFLTLFVDAIEIARERLRRSPDKHKRIVADDVWDASARFNGDRRAEFNSDVRLKRPEILVATVEAIREFCFSNELNCILVPDRAKGDFHETIDEVWDCKLLHTVMTKLFVEAQQHTAYMLDVSEQASNWYMRRIIVDLGEDVRRLKERLSNRKYVFSMKEPLPSGQTRGDS